MYLTLYDEVTTPLVHEGDVPTKGAVVDPSCKLHNNNYGSVTKDKACVQRNGFQDKDAGKGVVDPSAEKEDSGRVRLKRKVGLISGIALNVGCMIGSGIFITPTGVLKNTGSPGLSLVVWLSGGVLSLLGALCYAELGTSVPHSGGDFAYYKAAFGGRDKLIGHIPAFLYNWTSMVVLRPGGTAVVMLAFAQYAVSPFNDSIACQGTSKKILAAVAISLIAFINCWSVKLATAVQNFFTLAKISVLIVIISAGMYNILVLEKTENLEVGFEGSKFSMTSLAMAFYGSLFAYDGWANANFVTEELKNPEKNLPKAIVSSVLVVTFIYVLTNLSYLAVLTQNEILQSDAVALAFGKSTLGLFANFIPIFVAFSTFGAVNGGMFSGGRTCYAAAREGHLMNVLSFIHVKRYTPVPAVIFNASLALLMVIPGDISALVNFTSFVVCIFYTMTMVALISMRFTRPTLHRPYKVPLVIPVVLGLLFGFLWIAPIIDKPAVEYLYAAILILSGLVFYFPFVYARKRFACSDTITIFLQLLLHVVPTEVSPEDEKSQF